MSEEPALHTSHEIQASIEALLFVATEPVTPEQLSQTLCVPLTEVTAALADLESRYRENGGLSLQRFAGRVQLTTAARFAPFVERFLGLEATTRLSRAALEALAIIAYRQPVTRPGIDAIRGVNSDGVLKSLLGKGLVEEVGRSETPGRPILYGTSTDFLQHFGLSSLDELPPFDDGETIAANHLENGLLKD